MSNIKTILDKLWGTIIESFAINLLDHTINLAIKRIEGETEKVYEVSFEEVVAFCWNNDFIQQGKARYNNLDQWRYIDLASIVHRTTSKICINVLSELYTKQPEFFPNNNGEIKVFASPNIEIEIWNSILLIEAKRVIVNGKIYLLDSNQ